MSEPGAGIAEKAGIWEDFVDIFHAPSEVFARRRREGFWIPLLIVAAITTFVSFATSRILRPALDADSRRQRRQMLEQNPDLDLAAGQGAMDSLETFMTFSAGFFEAVMVMVTGLVLFMGAKLAGSRLSARSGILIATYAVLVLVLQDMVAIVEGLIRGPSTLESMSQLSWSPARLLDPDTATPLQSFLASRADLFTIWWLALLAIGLATLGDMKRRSAAAVVVSIWAVVTVPGLAVILLR